MRFRRHLSIGLLAVAATCGSLFACTGEDADVPTGGGADAATGEGSVASDANVVADGGVESGGDGAAGCSGTLPFRDDFEQRSDLKGCWDGLTTIGTLASTSSGELGLLGLSHGFRVKLAPPDAGVGTGGVYLVKKLAAPASAPVSLAFKWTVEAFPPGGDGSNGLFAVELAYEYKDPGGFLQSGRTSVAFGVNDKTINPYLKSASYLPLDALEGGPFESSLALGAGQIKLSTKSMGTDRVIVLPTGSDFAVTEIRIGVTEVGSFAAPWTLFFDDVLLEQK